MSCKNLKTLLGNIANAIRAKGGTTGQICGEDLPQAVLDLETGGTGITPTGTKSITSNGTHDVTTYANASVNVPIPAGYIKPTGTKSITSNGTHDVTTFANASVNVPIPTGYIKPSGTKAIATNGIHDVTSYASVNVNVVSEGSLTLDDVYVLGSSVKASTTMGNGLMYRLTDGTNTDASDRLMVVNSDSIIPENIRKGKIILGVEGDYAGESSGSTSDIEWGTIWFMSYMGASKPNNKHASGLFRFCSGAEYELAQGSDYEMSVDELNALIATRDDICDTWSTTTFVSGSYLFVPIGREFIVWTDTGNISTNNNALQVGTNPIGTRTIDGITYTGYICKITSKTLIWLTEN